MAIMKVDHMKDLPAASKPLGIPSKDFPNAYAELKRGNFTAAANILRYCRGLIDPHLFDYLMRDPLIRKFASRPEVAEFY